MAKLTDAQRVWLERIAGNGGTWADRPFLRDAENSVPLMRAGLVEVIAPEAPAGRAKPLPYAAITDAGRSALTQEDA